MATGADDDDDDAGLRGEAITKDADGFHSVVDAPTCPGQVVRRL